MTNEEYRHLQEVLDKLLAYKVGSNPVLSVYLKNPNGALGAKLSEEFQHLIKESLTAGEVSEVRAEIDTINAYLLNEYEMRPHISAISFFAGEHLWEVINHDFLIEDSVCFSHSPFVAPLVQEIAKDGRYLFVVADREKADIFTFHKGVLEAYTKIYDASVPQEVKSNKGDYYGRNDIIQRHIGDHLHRHLQKISEEVDAFIKDKSIQGVFIGGHKDLFRELKDHLDKNLQKKLRGEFITELNIPQTEILHHAQKTLELFLSSV